MTIQFLRGTTAKTATYTGANGELTVDTTKKAVVVHDATKAGGYAQATEAGVQASAYNTAAAAGEADALTAVFTPAITALTNGMTLYVRAGAANTTTTPTFTPATGTIAAKAIVKGAGSALAAGDIAGPGHWIELQYDLTLDKWVLQNPAKGTLLTSTNAWQKGQSGAVVALTDAATIAVNLELGNNFSVTLSGNRTLGFPTNVAPGQSGLIVVRQDGTGGRALAFASGYKFASGVAPSIVTTANAVNFLPYYVEAADRIYVGFVRDVK